MSTDVGRGHGTWNSQKNIEEKSLRRASPLTVFLFFYSLAFLFLFLDLAKEHDVTSHVMVTNVTKHNKSMIYHIYATVISLLGGFSHSFRVG